MRDLIGELLQKQDLIGELLKKKPEEELEPPKFMPAETLTTYVAEPDIKAKEEELLISQPVPGAIKQPSTEIDIFGPLRGVAYTINTAPQAIGSLIKEYGERMEDNPDFWDLIMAAPTMGMNVLQKKLLSEVAPKTDWDEKIAKAGDEIIRGNERYIKKLTSIHPREGKINELLFSLGSGATSLAGAIGLSYLTKSPHAAAVAFGAYQKGLMYEEARRAGLEPTEAGRISTLGGMVEGGLEYVGLHLILGKYAGNILGTMATEGFQEFSQELGGNLVAKLGYDRARNVWQGVWEAAAIGAILGAPASVMIGTIKGSDTGVALDDAGVDVGGVVENIQKRITPEIERIAKDDFIKMSDKMVNELVEQDKRLKVEEKEVVDKPIKLEDIKSELMEHSKEVMQSGVVKNIELIGSLAEKGVGRDVDIIYDLGEIGLPEGITATDMLIEYVEKNDIPIGDIPYDTWILADGRYFHKTWGAGPDLIESNEYAKQQVGKPKISLVEPTPKLGKRPLSETEKAKLAEEEAAKRKLFEPEKALWKEMLEPTEKKTITTLPIKPTMLENMTLKEIEIASNQFGKPLVMQPEWNETINALYKRGYSGEKLMNLKWGDVQKIVQLEKEGKEIPFIDITGKVKDALFVAYYEQKIKNHALVEKIGYGKVASDSQMRELSRQIDGAIRRMDFKEAGRLEGEANKRLQYLKTIKDKLPDVGEPKEGETLEQFFVRIEQTTSPELALKQQAIRKPPTKPIQTEIAEAAPLKMQDEFIKPTTAEEVETSRKAMENTPLFEPRPSHRVEQPGIFTGPIDAQMQSNLANLGFSIGQINKMNPETAGNILHNKIKANKISILPDGSFKLTDSKYRDPFTGDFVTREEYDFLTRGEETLWEAIRSEGGIKSYKPGPGALKEEYKEVPIFIRNNEGLPLDEMADALSRRHGHLGITSEADLIEALRTANLEQVWAGLNLRTAWEGLKGFYMTKIGQPAFNQLSKLVPKTLKKYFTPYHGWNEYVKYLYRDMIYERIAYMADASEIMPQLMKLTQPEKIAAYYLATKQALPADIKTTPKAEAAAQLINMEFNRLGDEAVKLGLMPEESFRKFFDRYLPRLYEVYERAARQPGLFRKSLKLDLQRFMHRNEDLPAEWREAAGEIKNVEELFSKGVIKEVYDITLNKFHKRLKTLPAEFTEGIKAVVTPAEAKAMTELGQFDINQYYRLPDTKFYGDLRNCYIRADIWNDLKGMYRTSGQWDEIIRIHNKLLTLWKLGKTVFSPATQMRNFYFGMIQCDWGDGWNLNAIKEFTKAIATKNETYRELKHQGILTSGMVQVEMMDYLKKINTTNNRFEKVVDFSTDLLMEKLQGKRAAQLYGASDDLFRSLIYVSQRQKGLPQDQARDLANFYMVNYREVGPAIKLLRMGPTPFITFYNGFLQAAAHTAVVKPWKMAKLYLLLSLIGAKGLKEAKELRERKQKAMPQYVPQLIPNLLPALRLPWKTQQGSDLYLDLTYVFPFLDMGVEFFKMAKGELKPLHPGAAAVRAVARFVNHPGFRWLSDVAIQGMDSFTKEELDTPDKIFDYTYKQLMPSLAPEIPFTGVKGGWGYEAFKKAVEKRPTAGRGYIRSIPETVARHVLGVKTLPVDYTEELSSRIRYATYLISEAEGNIIRVAKDKSLKPVEKHQETQTLVAEIKRLGEMIKNWQKQRDWFTQREKSIKKDFIGDILNR